MTPALVHVIGAGLAGLSCAVEAVKAGHTVVVYEAAPQAGGRCRSFMDRTLGRVIDNGTHLILSGNTAVRDYARTIGAAAQLQEGDAAYPFLDLETGTRWTVRPNDGRLPWWIAVPWRRVPDTHLLDYLPLLRLAKARTTDTVADKLDTTSTLYRRLLDPLATAILNTEGTEASARLLGSVMQETVARGGAAMRPLFAPDGLGKALIEPAVDWLRSNGARLHMGDPLMGLTRDRRRVIGLKFRSGHKTVAPHEAVVLALPPAVACRILPDEVPPLALRPIINVHFLVEGGGPRMLGLIGGTAQWLFSRGDVVSITISAASRWLDLPDHALIQRVWHDVAQALDLDPDAVPPARLIKERRATLAHSPGQEILRPPVRTRLENLCLAGDWTATGLPCTLEGAVRSGRMAARLMHALEPA